jgi:hypothetical protein
MILPMPDCRMLAAISMLALFSCKTKEASRELPPATNLLPTATEVFELRSKCAALGHKIMEDNTIGSALTQEQLSHYSPETNHCYVKLDVHTANLAIPQDQFLRDEYLFDGQTQEMLASASWKGDKKSAYILSDSLRHFAHDPVFPTYDEVDAMMTKFMAEDRRP